MRWGRLSGLAAVAAGAAAVVVAGTVHPTLTQPSPRPCGAATDVGHVEPSGVSDSTAAATTVFAVSPNPGRQRAATIGCGSSAEAPPPAPSP